MLLGCGSLSPTHADAQGNDAWDKLEADEDFKKDGRERVNDTLENDYPIYVEEIESLLKDFMKKNARVDRYVAGVHQKAKILYSDKNRYEKMPARHPMLGDPTKVRQTGGVKYQGGPSEDTDILSRGVKNPGIADSSKDDYITADTKVIFNQDTLPHCMEERQVAVEGEQVNETHPYFMECRKRCTPGWVTFTGERATSCIPCHGECLPGTPNCWPCKFNQFYVSEYYWPAYVSRTYPGRAMGSFNPYGDYLYKDGDPSKSDQPIGDVAGQQLAYEYSRDTSYDRFMDYLVDYYETVHGQTGKNKKTKEDFQEAFPEEFYFAFDYTGRDLNVTSGQGGIETQSNHTLVYMTNANRQLSRRMRPPTADNWKGYVEEDRCFFNTLPDARRLAVSHGNYPETHDFVTFQYQHEGINEPNKAEGAVQNRGSASNHAMLGKDADADFLQGQHDVYDVIKKLDQEFGSGVKQPEGSLMRMWGQTIEMREGWYKKAFNRIGVDKRTHWQDWLYHNFFRLYHSRNQNLMEDPLYSKIIAGFAHYTLNSLPTFDGNLILNESSDKNEWVNHLRRPLLWSFSAGRGLEGSNPRDGENYTSVGGIGPGKIFSADKIQVIYPTIDGKKGSSCFKPESLAKSEYFDPEENEGIDAAVGTGNFWGFRRDLYKRLLEEDVKDVHNFVREVRIAYWTKRVNCNCTICSRLFLGCSVLNTGDYPDDYFYGKRVLENKDPILFPEKELKTPVIRWKNPVNPIPGSPPTPAEVQQFDPIISPPILTPPPTNPGLFNPGNIARGPGQVSRLELPDQNDLKVESTTARSVVKNVSFSVDSLEDSQENAAAWPRYQDNRSRYGDYSVSPYDDLYRSSIRLVGDSPWLKKKARPAARSLIDSVEKAQEGQLEANARKIGLRKYGKHALDDDVVEPKEGGRGDPHDIGIDSIDDGTPGPINAGGEDFLQGNDKADDDPGEVGPITPQPDGDKDNPPPNASTIGPIYYCLLKPPEPEPEESPSESPSEEPSEDQEKTDDELMEEDDPDGDGETGKPDNPNTAYDESKAADQIKDGEKFQYTGKETPDGEPILVSDQGRAVSG